MSAPVLSTLADQINQALALGAVHEAAQIAQAAHEQQPADAGLLLQLGQLLLRAGELHSAHQALLKLLQLRPELSLALQARCELSAACLAASDPHTAAAWLADACRIAPEQPALWLQLARFLGAQNRAEEAGQALQQGLAINPEAPGLLQSAAEHAMQRLDYAAALPLFARLNQLLPNQVGILLNYGYCQEHCLLLQEAVATYRACLQLDANFMEAHVDLAGLLWRLEDFEGSLAHARRAVALAPEHPYAVRILGTALFQGGQIAEARMHLERSLALKPDFAIASIDLAMLQLLCGELDAGWRTYQTRWNDTARLTRPDFYLPHNEWQGPQAQPLEGKRILIYGEQGFGDVIQFIRYAVPLQALGAEVFCQIPLPLVPLAQRMTGLQCLLPQQQLHTHYHVALMDLPLHLPGEPPPAPYLSAAPAALAQWRGHLQGWQGLFKIGIAWAGNPAHANHHNRSAALSLFAPVLALPGVQCFSLQKSAGGDYTDITPEPAALVDLTPQWQDFMDSAAMISALDLVICVDSAVAHLAGALGTPVWLLLPPNPDWRWLQAGESSAWYPSMRLFRREHGEGREAQMARLLQALKAHTFHLS